MLDQILLLATLRHRHLDLVAGFGGERFRQELAVVDLVRDQNQPRTGLVVVELREKRRQELARRDRAIGFRKIGAIAPVLPSAEKEYFDAGETALLMQRENIGLLHTARIDALMRLNSRQRGKAVAVDGGAFEIERLRSLFHLGRELVFDGLAAAGQERIGLAHQHRIFAEVDLIGTRRRAALDLMKKARARTALEERVAA